MRTCGEMRHLITLMRRVQSAVGGDSREKLEPVATVRAARRDMTQREFAAAGADNYEKTVVYTVRTPRQGKLCAGLVIADGDERLRVAQAIDNRPERGFTELRAVGGGLQGEGYYA